MRERKKAVFCTRARYIVCDLYWPRVPTLSFDHTCVPNEAICSVEILCEPGSRNNVS